MSDWIKVNKVTLQMEQKCQGMYWTVITFWISFRFTAKHKFEHKLLNSGSNGNSNFLEPSLIM